MEISTLFINNIAPIMGLVFLLIALIKNKSLDDAERKWLWLAWFTELLEMVSYEAEKMTATWAEPSALRILFSAVGYTVRPAIIYIFIRLLLKDEKSKLKLSLLFIPEIAATLLGFSAFFTDIAYSFNEKNTFISGPFHYVNHGLIILYLLIFVVCVIRKGVLEKRIEAKMMILIVTYISVALVLESMMNIENVGRTAIVICTCFFVFSQLTSKLKATVSALEENRELREALLEVERTKHQLLLNQTVTQALGEDYLFIFHCDLRTGALTFSKKSNGFDFSVPNTRIDKVLTYEEYLFYFVEHFVVPEDREGVLEAYNRHRLIAALKEKNSFIYRYNCNLGDEGICCVESHAVHVKSELDPDSVVIGLRNVEEMVKKEREQMDALKKAVADARRANVAKSNFLSRMSHDIRTPLNGIIGLIEISEQHPDDVELLTENRKKAKIAASHLLSLINDVLDMSKLEDGNTVLLHEAIDIRQLMTEVMTIVELRAKDAEITVNYDSCCRNFDTPFIYGSPLHIRQIFLNIFSNAIKYNKEHGSINAKCDVIAKDETTVTYRFVISDTGIGMSREFLTQLYEPFTQERNDARSFYQGTGLGMAIVKALIEKMNGTIDVTSWVGEGTTFTIILPFEIAPEKEIISESTVNNTQNIEGVRILLAEDNELNMEIATTLLEEAGAIITPVPDGQECYNTFCNNLPGTFDVILMDIMMPNMNGIEATKAIRTLDRTDATEIPILAMTANAFAEDVQRVKEAGMNEHLSKPLDINKVLAAINEYCKK